MKTGTLILAVAAVMALPGLSSAQQSQRYHGHMQQGMMMNRQGHPMMGMMGIEMGMWMQPGPRFLLDQKSTLDLSGDQVQQLERLSADWSTTRESHADRVSQLRRQVAETMSGDQPDLGKYQSALQSLANEYVAMQVESARYSEKAVAVLNDNQRSYVHFGMLMMRQMDENMFQYGQMMMEGGMTRGVTMGSNDKRGN